MKSGPWVYLCLFFLLSCPSSKESQRDLNQDSSGKTLVESEGAAAVASKKILFLGDSLTEGYGIEKQNAYPSLLAKKIEAENLDYHVLNASISGSTSASAVGRLKWQLSDPPGVLVLALGANDGLRGIDPQSTKKNLEASIALAKDNGIEVLLIGMKLPFNYGLEYREAFEQTFADLAKKHELAYIPFLLKNVGGIAERNISDGIHPNEKGHQIMAENVWPTLKAMLQ